MLAIPDGYRTNVREYATDADDWLGGLPGLADRYLAAWDLVRDGEDVWHGYVGIVVPVRMPDGTAAALKISYPSPESAHEAAALAEWAGRGAVRVLRADPAHQVLLLERLDNTRSLRDVPVPQAVSIWGALMRELSAPLPPGPQPFESLAELSRRWLCELPDRWERLGRPGPAWLLDEALAVCRDAAVESTLGQGNSLLVHSSSVLVHTDLHFENVLATPDGARWRAIDPKPLLGVAEFAVAPMLWNRLGELDGGAEALRARCHALSEAAGLDRELARRWSVAREVENHLEYLESGLPGDATRSLWVATALCGRADPGVDPAGLASL
ncbi:aminoglycoside phosphotransferase family protein [Rhodococcus kronopolitis]|uniref:Aminoglycoside phosphotransferase family protein n=1 Tax=Rhodococcus kronopolitis TaxID=1460226 RepID=A0ABV9FNP9_9NOCA